MIIIQPVILFLFDFGDGGQYDAPFDATLYSRNELRLPSITHTDQQIAIDLHLIDSDSHVIKAIRSFTFPPELTIDFLQAVQEQLAGHFSQNDYQLKLTMLYQDAIDNLIKKNTMYRMGT